MSRDGCLCALGIYRISIFRCTIASFRLFFELDLAIVIGHQLQLFIIIIISNIGFHFGYHFQIFVIESVEQKDHRPQYESSTAN